MKIKADKNPTEAAQLGKNSPRDHVAQTVPPDLLYPRKKDKEKQIRKVEGGRPSPRLLQSKLHFSGRYVANPNLSLSFPFFISLVM